MSHCLSKQRSQRSSELDVYLDSIQGIALLSAEEERRLSEASRQGDLKARDCLVQANLRLVVKIAREFLRFGLNFEDLVGEGNLGLIRAAKDYNPAFGTRFSTYAAIWIRQSIRHALINTTSTIRLPAHMVGLLTKWRRLERQITRQEGEAPDADRLARELGLTDNQRVLIEHAQRARRLCHETTEEWGGWSADEVRDPHESPETRLEADEERKDLKRRMNRLDSREKTVITLRFGLSGQQPLTLKKVGSRLGVTREWVRKIEQRAIRKLDDKHPETSPAAVAAPSSPLPRFPNGLAARTAARHAANASGALARPRPALQAV